MDRDNTLFITETEKGYAKQKKKIIGLCIIALCILPIKLMGVNSSDEYIEAAVFCIAVLAAGFFIAKSFWERAKASYNNLKSFFLDMPDDDFEQLLKRSHGFEKMYKSFYMLENYFWAPDLLLLIPYSDIIEAKIKFNRRRRTAAIILSCKDRQEHKIPVYCLSLFMEEYTEVQKMLDKKIYKS